MANRRSGVRFGLVMAAFRVREAIVAHPDGVRCPVFRRLGTDPRRPVAVREGGWHVVAVLNCVLTVPMRILCVA